jgi:hypothetical protein
MSEDEICDHLTYVTIDSSYELHIVHEIPLEHFLSQDVSQRAFIGCCSHCHTHQSDETSCNTLSFALYEISRNPDVQQKLYKEVVEILGNAPIFEHDALEQMVYLQAVIKETLRLHSVVAHGLFKAGQDNAIPLSFPIVDKNGKKINVLHAEKGQRVVSL